MYIQGKFYRHGAVCRAALKLARLFLFLIAFACIFDTSTQAQTCTDAPGHFYVSTSGTAYGDGSCHRPWDLPTALAHPSSLKPGDTLWIRGGTYEYRNIVSQLTGTRERPVTIRNFNHERVSFILDKQYSAFSINGAHTTWWGIEWFNSNTRREEAAADHGRGTMTVNVTGTRLINCLIHDVSHVLSDNKATDVELHGCLIYNNGFVDSCTNKPLGHGLYVQNLTGNKQVRECILFGNYDFGMHAYSQGSQIKNLLLDGNIAFGNRGANWLVGGAQGVDDVEMTNSHLYGSNQNLILGFGEDAINRQAEVRHNRIVGGYRPLQFTTWYRDGLQSLRFTDNLLVVDQAAELTIFNEQRRDIPHAGINWNRNEIYRTVDTGFWQRSGGRTERVVNRRFEEWQRDLGFDTGSRFHQGRPAGVEVFVRANGYEAGRAHIIVYNWDGNQSVGVDPNSGEHAVLSYGDEYEVRFAGDYFGAPVASGYYMGGLINIPMTNLTITAPIGDEARRAASTAPYFGAFVLMRK